MSMVELLFYSVILVSTLPGIRGADPDWWESATLYQIYPRSFQDSDGNGVGDLNGITSRLQYLREIGVTATWLSPVFESPMADFGYDISNFTRIDPSYGTLADFDAMIAKAKDNGVKILLDFVPNHSSDECEWFQNSIDRVNGFDDFYVWADGYVDPENESARLPPSNWVSVFGGPMWKWNAKRQQFYLHQFLDKQPDLNFSSPMVREHLKGVLKYWLDRGVDGFRIDAVPHFVEHRNADGSYPDEPVSGWSTDQNSYDYHNHIYTKEQPETAELLYEWREFLDQYRVKNGGDTRVLLAEAYAPVNILSDYCGNGTHAGAHLPMNFNLMYFDGKSTARDVEFAANSWMETMWARHQMANWVVGNHDNGRVANRMGRHKVDLLNVIVNAMPGASVTYYGEEIAMKNAVTECTPISCEDRDPERSPMQWNQMANAGFSTAPSTWLPVSEDYTTYNVKSERGVARSSLNIFKALQKLKRSAAFKAFKEPEGFSYGAINEKVFQIVRSAKQKEEYRILVNMGDRLEALDALSDKIMEAVVLNSFSPRNYGDKIDLRKTIFLMPNEAIVLHWMA